MKVSRRNFLFGGFKKVTTESFRSLAKSDFRLRPPGAVAEKEFLKLCDPECQDCLKVCPPRTIRKVQDQLSPDFMSAFVEVRLGGCDYCFDFPCISACKTGALSSKNRRMATARVMASCLTRQREPCTFCIPACPDHIKAFRINPEGLVTIDPDACVGCGKCVIRCFLIPKAIDLTNSG